MNQHWCTRPATEAGNRWTCDDCGTTYEHRHGTWWKVTTLPTTQPRPQGQHVPFGKLRSTHRNRTKKRTSQKFS